MAEESSGPTRDSRGRFLRRRREPEPETADAAPGPGQDAAGARDADIEMETIDISDTTAPSIGPHTTMQRPVGGAHPTHSAGPDVDAMGKDKRRRVIGQSYGPSVARQASVYGIFLAVMAAVVIGFLLLAKELDKAPASYADEAPWSSQNAPQEPPTPIE